jgi:3'(2'), 5'-bisphosphate nucleotidase
MPEPRAQLLPGLRQIALQAGAVIMNIYQGHIAVRAKADQSPVTEADEAAEAVILAALAELAPQIPVIAEESVAAGRIPEIGEGPFWLVDPLDGTKEFISRNGEFTVNVALIEDGLPTLGVVFAPAIGQLYLAGPGAVTLEKDGGAARPIAVRRPAADGLVVVASRSHRDSKTDDYLADFEVKSLTSAGSSLKLCLVAAGEADLYPRLGRTMEWDIAAGHAVLAAAGGRVETLEGAPLSYGKPGFENPFFVARGA